MTTCTSCFTRITLLAKKDSFHGPHDCMLSIESVTNVTIDGNGAILQMRRDDYAWGTCSECQKYSRSEWRHGLYVSQSDSVTVRRLTIVETGGDGLYIGGTDTGASRNVHISDCVLDRNYRQGMSVATVANLLVERRGSGNTNGTKPHAGVDIEPDKWSQRQPDLQVASRLATPVLGSRLTVSTSTTTHKHSRLC